MTYGTAATYQAHGGANPRAVVVEALYAVVVDAAVVRPGGLVKVRRLVVAHLNRHPVDDEPLHPVASKASASKAVGERSSQCFVRLEFHSNFPAKPPFECLLGLDWGLRGSWAAWQRSYNFRSRISAHHTKLYAQHAEMPGHADDAACLCALQLAGLRHGRGTHYPLPRRWQSQERPLRC